MPIKKERQSIEEPKVGEKPRTLNPWEDPQKQATEANARASAAEALTIEDKDQKIEKLKSSVESIKNGILTLVADMMLREPYLDESLKTKLLAEARKELDKITASPHSNEDWGIVVGSIHKLSSIIGLSYKNEKEGKLGFSAEDIMTQQEEKRQEMETELESLIKTDHELKLETNPSDKGTDQEKPAKNSNHESIEEDAAYVELAKLLGAEAMTQEEIDEEHEQALNWDKTRKLVMNNNQVTIPWHRIPEIFNDDDEVMLNFIENMGDNIQFHYSSTRPFLSERLQKDRGFNKKAIKINPDFLVPSGYWSDPEMSEIAIRSNPKKIANVTQLRWDIDPEICKKLWKIALEANPRLVANLFPDNPDKKEIWKIALEKDPSLLFLNRNASKDLELILVAARKDPKILMDPGLDPDVKTKLQDYVKRFTR
ncbi:DUF4116 domain-containing protein [Patescibacteria group bacterium]|nr:DUF4116 domain-containing protein [Patescibacteria group bacterium]